MAEHKCVVGYCCCGCSLKSGSLAIGIVVLIISLLQSIYAIFLAVKSGSATEWVSFFTNLIVVIVSCILIQGVRQERRSYVMTWAITMMVFIVINLILAIILLVTLNFSFGVTLLISTAIFFYLVIVVRSYALSIGSSAGVA